MSKIIYYISGALIGSLISVKCDNITLNSRINTLQSDSIQSHKRIFQLTNQITKDTCHKWCIKMQ